MQGDRYIVLKLVSGEEIIAHLIGEDDYEIKILFPMIVRHVPRMTPHGPGESISMSPYTYFSAEDEYTFHKNQIIFIKDLDARYEAEYNRAIDDFVGSHTPQPYNPEELQELTDKLQTMFKDKLKEEDIDDLPFITVDIPKTIH
jgi:hypothetical protein